MAPRNLTDDDVKAIAAEVEERLTQRFFLNVGKGFWALTWKGLIALALAVAAYGAYKGVK
jgi:hypothetical protein